MLFVEACYDCEPDALQEELEHQVQDVRTVFDGKFLSLTHRTDELHHNVLNRLGEIKAFMAKSKKVIHLGCLRPWCLSCE